MEGVAGGLREGCCRGLGFRVEVLVDCAVRAAVEYAERTGQALDPRDGLRGGAAACRNARAPPRKGSPTLASSMVMRRA